MMGTSILSFDKEDGAVVLDWYLTKGIGLFEFEDANGFAQTNRDYFLIAKTDAALTRCGGLYAVEEK